MRRLLFQVLSVSLLGLSVGAHASTINAGTYSLNNVTVTDLFNHTYTLTGDVVLNGSGLATSADITLNDAALGNLDFNIITAKGGPSGYNPTVDNLYLTTATGSQLVLYYSTVLDSSGNIDLCVNNFNCNWNPVSYLHIYGNYNGPTSFGYNPVALSSGGLNLADTNNNSLSAVPEPASLALFGTGIVFAAGTIRRKLVRS